jgi:hypothetical protein
MVMDMRDIKMEMYMKGSLNWERRMAKVIIHGTIKMKSMMVSGSGESGKVMVCGKMLEETATWVNGITAKLSVMESLHGLMGISMRANGIKV